MPLAVAVTPGAPQDQPVRAPLAMTWTGWDGSVWDLTPGSTTRLKQGVRGLGMPPVRRYSSRAAAVPGSRHRGGIADEREVFWPLEVVRPRGGSEQDWRDLDAAFWRTMDPDRPGTWQVGARRLQLRYVDDGRHTYDVQPSALGRAVYGILLVAEQPFWTGDSAVRRFTADEPIPFFGADRYFRLDPGSNIGTATIDNPGDVDAYPVWTVVGPVGSATVGVGDRVIEVPFAVPDGQSLIIDPRPTAQTAIDSLGVERTGELGEVDFAAVPPGASAELTVVTTGGDGYVTAELTPLFYRAW